MEISAEATQGRLLEAGIRKGPTMLVLSVNYTEPADEALHHALSLTLPSKWAARPCEKLVLTFVDSYNVKFPRTPLDASAAALWCERTEARLAPDDAIGAALEPGDVLSVYTPRPRGEDDPAEDDDGGDAPGCLLYTSPSPRDGLLSRMPSSA